MEKYLQALKVSGEKPTQASGGELQCLSCPGVGDCMAKHGGKGKVFAGKEEEENMMWR